MNTRTKMDKADPAVYAAMAPIEKYLAECRLTTTHKELIKIRASQINGCAFCIDKHTKDARKAGETEQRIYALNAWRETPFFTPEEQAILALTEEITFIHQHVSDATYEAAAKLFDEQYLAQIIMAAAIINTWNRIGIATGMQPAIH